MGYFKNLSNVKKLLVYLGSSVVGGAVDAGFVPAQYTHYVQLTLFFLTSIGIYAARNQKPEVRSAVDAAAQDAVSIADGDIGSIDDLRKQLDALQAAQPPKHAAPADLPPVPAAPVPALPVIPEPIPLG